MVTLAPGIMGGEKKTYTRSIDRIDLHTRDRVLCMCLHAPYSAFLILVLLFCIHPTTGIIFILRLLHRRTQGIPSTKFRNQLAPKKRKENYNFTFQVVRIYHPPTLVSWSSPGAHTC